MKGKLNCFGRILVIGSLALAPRPALAQTALSTNPGYSQTNLVSDLSTNALRTDDRLVNPWGVVAGLGLVWVNDNGPGLTTAYGSSGVPLRSAIQVPAPGGGSGGTPSGLVFNDTLQFVVTKGTLQAPSTFLISTEDGTIAAWNRAVTGSNAVIVVDNSASGAVYKGLAIVRDANNVQRIYASNFHVGVVDVFDGQFKYVSSFTDSNVPALFAPFGMRNIRGRVFVTFAEQKLPDLHDDQAGPGNGFVDIFDTDGTLLRRFASQGVLNSPWGMALAPKRFGKFSHALLVGNFGDGMINAFDLLTGKLLGHLTGPDGTPVVIEGLWGLAFDRDEIPEHESDFVAQRLYFTAGINDEADGLFGNLRPVAPLLTPAR